MKVAALDLGSNTFLCLIAEVNENGISKVYQDLVEVVRLGRDINQTKMLHPEALKRAKETLSRFKIQIEKEKVSKVLAMATSAARDAKNGHLLLELGKSLDIPIEIIAGSDEARLTYKGALVGHDFGAGRTLVIDVGGGSTELILGEGHQLLFSKSLDLGGVRLTEKFITAQPISPTEINQVEQSIRNEAHETLKSISEKGLHQVLAVAGTPTSIAAIELGGFVESKVDGYKLTLSQLVSWQKIFSSTTVEEKKQKYGLGGRADIIYVGVTILVEILRALKKEEMIVSTKGVRYGVAMEILAR